jgi:dolichol-phosphate mannosyltransferase
MRSNECRDDSRPAETLSLILPLTRGTLLEKRTLTEYRQLLEREGVFRSVEVIVARVEDDPLTDSWIDGRDPGEDVGTDVTVVTTEDKAWSELARAGLYAATGDHLMVLDVDRHYAPESLLSVLEPVLGGESDLAVAVPPKSPILRLGLQPIRAALGLASRIVLGSSDVFSGLFVVGKPLWHKGGRSLVASGPSLVLELLLRRPARCVDVPVPVGPQFRPQRFQFRDLRPLKHVLDGRYGSWSRLIQFCFVGASGMVVDLTFYALFQWLLAFTRLASVTSPRFGFSWNLAIAGAISIAIALLWNFTLNRRLTFNDARGGSWIRQFLTYALSNALAIALSFTVRLILPTQVDFFGRHRLAAAVVGIVMATGISFSMSRWIVFTRRPPTPRPPARPPSPRPPSQSASSHVAGQPQVSPPSVLA